MKSMSWFARLLLSIVFISGITVFTTWFMVNTYVSNLMVQLNLQDSYKQLSFMDLITQLQPQPVKKTNDSSKQVTAPIKNDPNAAKATGSDAAGSNTSNSGNIGSTGGEGSIGSTGVNGSAGSSSPPNPIDNSGKQYDAVSAWSQMKSGATQNSADNNKMMISSEDVLKKKELMSNEDRMTIFSILVAKLPQKELQTISQYMEDGITETEWQETQAILKKYLSEAENKQLLTIINKY